ncbi:MAG: MBL fold metallo-hydrolase [Defluviitaleaceae bacterium]|nr:MBL fold metallo-hydrolase [Defluviitaleaceae bacterium]
MKKYFFLLPILFFFGCSTQELSVIKHTYEKTAEFSIINTAEETGLMEIKIFGIGRADAVLITTQNHTVLIDTGENRHGRTIAHYMHGQNITSLDYLIITHFDSDHVGGAHEIIRFIGVENVIVPNYSRESRHVERFLAAKLAVGLESYVLKEEIRFTLDGAEFIVNPSALEYLHFPLDEDSDGDDFSIVVSVTHGENSFLFTGDAVESRLSEILAHEELSARHDFLKVPRHGRYNRHSVELIHAISPRYAVITGFHPDKLGCFAPERPADERVIAELESIGAEIFFTMTESVRIICDGHTMSVSF